MHKDTGVVLLLGIVGQQHVEFGQTFRLVIFESYESLSARHHSSGHDLIATPFTARGLGHDGHIPSADEAFEDFFMRGIFAMQLRREKTRGRQCECMCCCSHLFASP